MQASTLTFPAGGLGAEAAQRRAVAVLSTDGYKMQSASDTESIGIKRVIPAWAIVMTVIFGLFCLVGLLFLLVKEEREVKAHYIDGPDGGSIVITGVMSGKVIDRLGAEFNAVGPASSPRGSTSMLVTPSSPSEGRFASPPPAPLDDEPPGPPSAVVDEAATIAPPPGVSSTAWAGPDQGAATNVETPAVIGGSAVGAAAPASAADVVGYTIARPRHRENPAAPVVRFDDGVTLEIEDLVLIGRDPGAGPGEVVGRLVPLADESRGLSKTHASLVASGGTLWVADRHSTNGTSIISPTDGESACPPGDSVAVQIGDTVLFGGRRLVRVR